VSAEIKEEMAKRTDWGGLLGNAPATEHIGPVQIRAPAF
jgi:hypothetical protein